MSTELSKPLRGTRYIAAYLDKYVAETGAMEFPSDNWGADPDLAAETEASIREGDPGRDLVVFEIRPVAVIRRCTQVETL